MKNRNDRARRGNWQQGMSAGRVEYLEKARRKAAVRRTRIMGTAVAVLAIAVVVLTGALGSSVTMAKDLMDTVRIGLMPAAGLPQQTGLVELYQAEPMTGSFVALGKEGCAVYSYGGTRLKMLQQGYARPAIAAGSTRFVLYNRSGRELQVESRTQTLYTKRMDNNIYLCAVADGGGLAVATEDVRHVAELTAFSRTMETQFVWDMTAAEGVPVRMAFSPNSTKLAVAALTTQNGQSMANLYWLDTSRGDPVQLDSVANAMPWAVEWVSNSEILAIYSDHAVLYNAAGGVRAQYYYPGGTLVDHSRSGDTLALLFENGQVCSVLLLDGNLNCTLDTAVPMASGILCVAGGFYLMSDSAVEYFDASGQYQWNQIFATQPRALISARQPLMLSGNTVEAIVQPVAQEGAEA